MRILVLQLARLGDIYQAWPALRGLRRNHPDAEIHVLAREKFAGALQGLEAIDVVHILPTQEILSSALDDETAALEKVSQLTTGLAARGWDWIINLTFSPVSSYLAHTLQGEVTKLTGYTRFPDGYLAIPDAMSAYFYAQVGSGRPNRYHLAEIFATLCEVDIVPADWRPPELPELPVELPSEFVAVHIGGSEGHKALSVSKWISVLSNLRKLRPIPLVIIGAAAEKQIGEQIRSVAPDGEILNCAGDLTLMQSMALIQKARLLIGPDSGPIHMASLTGTPVLNLSLGQVKYWETGPRSLGSVVLCGETEDDLPSDQIADFVMRMLQQQRLPLGTIETSPGAPSFTGHTTTEEEFSWNLLRAIYQGEPFPTPIDDLFPSGLQQLDDVNRFMIETLSNVRDAQDLQRKAALLDRGEEIIETIAKLVPSLIPIVRWYQTEKIRVGPGSIEEIRQKNLETQMLLQGLIEVYRPPADPISSKESEVL